VARDAARQAVPFEEFSEKMLTLVSSPHETSTGKLKELRRITTDGYRYALDKLRRALGDDLTFPLSQSQIDEFVKKRFAAKISPRTINSDLRSIKAVLNLAVKHGILPEDSTPRIALYDVDDKAIEILTREQVNAVDAAATNRGPIYQLVIFSLMYQGLRPGDLSPYRQNSPQGIRWKHVNFDQHLIGVRGKTEKETDKWLPMNPKLESVLRNLPANHDGEARIFSYSRRILWKMVKEVFKDVGIEKNIPYVLRKTFVSYFSEVAGVDSAQGAARHSSIDATMRFYNHVRLARQHKGHEEFLAFFDDTKNGKDSSKGAEETIRKLLAEHPELRGKFVLGEAT
jgi:integrase